MSKDEPLATLLPKTKINALARDVRSDMKELRVTEDEIVRATQIPAEDIRRLLNTTDDSTIDIAQLTKVGEYLTRKEFPVSAPAETEENIAPAIGKPSNSRWVDDLMPVRKRYERKPRSHNIPDPLMVNARAEYVEQIKALARTEVTTIKKADTNLFHYIAGMMGPTRLGKAGLQDLCPDVPEAALYLLTDGARLITHKSLTFANADLQKVFTALGYEGCKNSEEFCAEVDKDYHVLAESVLKILRINVTNCARELGMNDLRRFHQAAGMRIPDLASSEITSRRKAFLHRGDMEKLCEYLNQTIKTPNGEPITSDMLLTKRIQFFDGAISITGLETTKEAASAQNQTSMDNAEDLRGR